MDNLTPNERKAVVEYGSLSYSLNGELLESRPLSLNNQGLAVDLRSAICKQRTLAPLTLYRGCP